MACKKVILPDVADLPRFFSINDFLNNPSTFLLSISTVHQVQEGKSAPLAIAVPHKVWHALYKAGGTPADPPPFTPHTCEGLSAMGRKGLEDAVRKGQHIGVLYVRGHTAPAFCALLLGPEQYRTLRRNFPQFSQLPAAKAA